MDELLAWGIAAFISNPNASDAELSDLLATGFPRGLAARAVAFLPLAYGRRLLRDMVTFADTFVVGDKEVPLASEPLFVLARKRADDAGRAEIEWIGLRSAEVNAVNKALHAGANAKDLVLTPPRLLALDGPTDGAVTVAAMLTAFFAEHQSKLACEARSYPSEISATRVNGQLDVMISAPALGGRRIVESFALYGSTIAEGRGNAVKKFARGTLHALLAALDGPRPDDSQVEWEIWGDFRVCLGALVVQWQAEVNVDFGPYIDEIKARLLAANLSREPHWFRTFVAVGKDGVFGHDVLLDNEPWPPGVDALTGWPWPRGEPAYALRHFFVLVPNDA